MKIYDVQVVILYEGNYTLLITENEKEAWGKFNAILNEEITDGAQIRVWENGACSILTKKWREE